MLRYQVTEAEGVLAIERTTRGRAEAALTRAAGAMAASAMVLLALTAVDAWMQPRLWGATWALALGGAALCGVVFGVLGWLSRSRWELDPARGVARWRVKTILGQEVEAALPLSEVATVDVTTRRGWGPRHQLWLRFRDGQGEALATSHDPLALAPIRAAILARLPPQKPL